VAQGIRQATSVNEAWTIEVDLLTPAIGDEDPTTSTVTNA